MNQSDLQKFWDSISPLRRLETFSLRSHAMCMMPWKELTAAEIEIIESRQIDPAVVLAVSGAPDSLVVRTMCPHCSTATAEPSNTHIITCPNYIPPSDFFSTKTEKQNVCEWVGDNTFYNLWKTDCGKSFQINEDGTPQEHEFQFCVFCGGNLLQPQTTQKAALMADYADGKYTSHPAPPHTPQTDQWQNIFSTAQQVEDARMFARGYYTAIKTITPSVDTWVEFSPTVDIHIDDTNVDDRAEAWAYPIMTDGGGKQDTDTQDGYQLF